MYRCKITDGNGNVVYSEPGMMCLDGLAVVAQPKDFVGWVGDMATFSVTARGENLAYQWQVSTNGGTSWSDSTAGGVTTATMNANIRDYNPGYLYRCKIMDGDGSVVYSEPGEIILAAENWTYIYDADGMRTNKRITQKFYAGDEEYVLNKNYAYFYSGSQLRQAAIITKVTVDGETRTRTETMNIMYDASGTPHSITYRAKTYYYVTNIQGDVIALLDNTGSTVVEYTYDAWGNILSTTGSMAESLGQSNPLRYRGYVYDQETGLYYLQSRYYDPEMGRFINSDTLVSTGQGLLGNNMFAYCRNNPVCRVDTTGYTDEKVQDDGTTEVGPDEDEIQGGGLGSTTAGNGNGTSTSPYMGGTYPAGQYYPNNPSTNPQYQPPKGGGGSTSSTNVKATQVDFSHGGRHIDSSKHNYLDIQENIAYDAVNQASMHQSGGYVKIIYDGLPIRYSYYLLGPNHINVGTYFIEIDY